MYIHIGHLEKYICFGIIYFPQKFTEKYLILEWPQNCENCKKKCENCENCENSEIMKIFPRPLLLLNFLVAVSIMKIFDNLQWLR